MLTATMLAIFYIPLFFVLVRRGVRDGIVGDQGAHPPPARGSRVKRGAALLALLATGCMSMEPKLAAPDPAIPPSWPVGDAYLVQSEATLPAVTYRDIFRDPRLQTLIAQALANNRDLMIAAANIAAAREQYVIQRAQQFPQVDASAGVTVSGNRSSGSSGSGSGTGSGSGSSGGSSSGVRANYPSASTCPASNSTCSAGCAR